MLYANVVLGLPVEGPFDYIVPKAFEKKASPGSRVRVNFCGRKMVGFVVGLSHKTGVRKLKELLDAPDNYPALDKKMLLLTKQLSQYYCCSWGEAIEIALPESLRKTARFSDLGGDSLPKQVTGPAKEITLIHDLTPSDRWKIYLERIKGCLSGSRQAIILLTDKTAALKAAELIKQELTCNTAMIYRNMPEEKEEWLKIKSGKVDVVAATRSGVFAPLPALGLIVIDEENDPVYKQDQAPHYHARQAALMRAKLEGAGVILSSASPSLESMGLVKNGGAEYVKLSGAPASRRIRIIDSKTEYLRLKSKGALFSKYIEDALSSRLNSAGKILVLINRRGFATSASCNNCKKPLLCPRCNINLVFHFRENSLSCHYCNFRMDSPKICPACNSGYIKFSGAGAEKAESELSRIFPQARIRLVENPDGLLKEDADIFISTSLATKSAGAAFDLVCVLGIDNSLNRPDFRSSEKVFFLLMGLLRLTRGELILQTAFPQHKVFEALLKEDPGIFYEQELKERKQLLLPPYRHLIAVKLRARLEAKAKDAAAELFKKLGEKPGPLRVLSLNPGEPAKLRGNFYWQVLLSCVNPEKEGRRLKLKLKGFRHSGVIVTVDVDPI